jgi:hypothetical protein
MYEGLRPLNEVHLSRLSPVMWTTRGGYPRKPLVTRIAPLDMSMGNADGRYAPVTGWNRYNSVANLRPIAFGSNGDATNSQKYWIPFLLGALGAAALAYLVGRQSPSEGVLSYLIGQKSNSLMAQGL